MSLFCRPKYAVTPQVYELGMRKEDPTRWNYFFNSGKVRTNMKNQIFEKSGSYVVGVLCVAIFFSCSKNITPTDTASKQGTTEQVAAQTDSLHAQPVRPGRNLSIDTLKHPLDTRLTQVWKQDVYYNQKVHDKVHRFYALSDYHTKWLGEYAPNPFYQKFTALMADASGYGLVPEDYTITDLAAKLEELYSRKPLDTATLIDLDIQISEKLFLFTTHLAEGKVRNPGNTTAVWLREFKPEDNTTDVFTLAKILEPEQLITAVNSLQPVYEQYAKLQQALKQYQTLEKAEPKEFPVSVAASKIKPDERNQVIPLIRKKLLLTDLKAYTLPIDSVTGQTDSLRYDAALVSAVKWFQERHGLEPDGIIGEKTVRFLNQSFRDKANIIAMNMERFRWLPQDAYGDNYITVNIPEYELRMFENGKEAFDMRVIVGAPNKPTPVFNDVVNHIIFSPTWTVPTSIIKEEIIPRLQKDSLYYTEKNYAFYKNEETIDPSAEAWKDGSVNPYKYRIVQQPGPDNSLGLVKFGMPNKMNIYLHDTPNHRLFKKSYRALSHGCVRLDEPARFAEYLLRDQRGWTKETVQKAMHAGTPATIHLRKKYPVHIEYRTAWVDENGLINFREDIYGHDKRQLQQLYPAQKPSAVAGI
jgi:murein L,D-transpeptidase YcbB/YkuD